MTEFKAGSYYTCIRAKTDRFTEGEEYPCFTDLNDGHLYIHDDMDIRLFCDGLESDFIESTNEQETTMTDNQRVFDLLEYVSRGVELGVDRDIIDDLLQMIRDEVRGTENEAVEPESNRVFYDKTVSASKLIDVTDIIREFKREMKANPYEVVGNPKVKAIMAIRERAGADLRDAKRFIDNYQVV